MEHDLTPRAEPKVRRRWTVRVEERLIAAAQQRAARDQKSSSEVVEASLEQYLNEQGGGGATWESIAGAWADQTATWETI